MTYTIKRTDGSTLTTVADQQIVKDAVPVALIGRGSVKYGRDHSENFIHLLENFAADTPPEHPMEGQFWFDKASGVPHVYTGQGTWAPLTMSATGEHGVTTAVSVAIDADTNAIAFVIDNKIIALVIAEAVENVLLPVAVRLAGQDIVVRERFPNGVVAGVNLATDAASYIFNGRVPVADRAHYVGGLSPLGATSVHQIDGKTAIVFVSQGRVGAVWSHAAATALPTNVTIGGINYSFATRFPTGLISGLTLAVDADVTYGISGMATQQALAQAISAEGTARASAIDAVKVWVDNSSATAMKMTDLTATFTSNTGTSTLAQAINHIIATANAGGSSAAAVTAIETTFKNTTGTTTLAQAANYLKTGADAGTAAATQVSTLNAAFTNATGISNVATAIQTMWTKANEEGSVSGWGVKLDVNGWWTGIEALNGGPGNEYVKIRTDRFIIGSPGSEIIPFEVRNGVVYMKSAVIENLSLGTDKIAPNALSATAHWQDNFAGIRASYMVSARDSYVHLSYGARTATVTITGVPADSRAILFASVSGRRNGGDTDRARFSVRRYNGSTFQYELPGRPQTSFPKDYATFTWSWVDNNITAAGDYSYRLFFARTSDEDGDTSDPSLYEVSLVALIVKK